MESTRHHVDRGWQWLTEAKVDRNQKSITVLLNQRGFDMKLTLNHKVHGVVRSKQDSAQNEERVLWRHNTMNTKLSSLSKIWRIS